MKEVGGDQSGVTGRVVGWRDLDQIAADQVQATTPPDDFQCLPSLQTTDFDRAGAKGKGGIKTVNVISEVNRMIVGHLAHPRHQRLH